MAIHKFQHFKIMFFETFNKVASNVFEILECIIIILIVAEIVNVSIVVWL